MIDRFISREPFVSKNLLITEYCIRSTTVWSFFLFKPILSTIVTGSPVIIFQTTILLQRSHQTLQPFHTARIATEPFNRLHPNLHVLTTFLLFSCECRTVNLVHLSWKLKPFYFSLKKTSCCCRLDAMECKALSHDSPSIVHTVAASGKTMLSLSRLRIDANPPSPPRSSWRCKSEREERRQRDLKNYRKQPGMLIGKDYFIKFAKLNASKELNLVFLPLFPQKKSKRNNEILKI